MNISIVRLGLPLAILSGCVSNAATVKSTGAEEIKPRVAAQATERAPELATVKGGAGANVRDPKLEAVALFPGPEQPVGIAVSKSGRVFMSFPRWADPVLHTVVELVEGKTVPFPNAATNSFDGTKLDAYRPDQHLISAQAITFDEHDRLWILDPGSFNFGPNILRGPKLWAYDIVTKQRVKVIDFPTDVALKSTYLNDVRIDLARGEAGTAYITDSGVGGIVVVDLATGKSWRHLDQHPSVLTAPGLALQSEGEPLVMNKPNGEKMAPDLRADGIALSPDGKTLYYTPVVSRDIYAIDTDLLAERDPANEQKVWAGVRKLATKPSGNDGLAVDAKGRIYSTDFEDNAIRRIDPSAGTIDVLTQDARLIWPDTLAVHGDQLYITSNQLARQPNFHNGEDLRKPPYALFRVSLNAR